jgi:hypothetical protein
MSTPVNLAAVHAMGSQFNTNVFEKIGNYATKKAVKINRANAMAAKANAKNKPPVPTGVVSGSKTTNFRTTKPAPTAALPAGSSQPQQFPGASTPIAIASSGGGHQPPFTAGATPHSNTGPNSPQIGSGRKPIATPYQASARVIPMSGNAALTNKVNPTIGFSNTGSQTPINRTPFNQPSQTPFKVNTMMTRNTAQPAFSNSGPATPAPQALPSGGKAAPTGPQFADVSTKDNSPFPTHVHPENSSNQILPNLSASMSVPGRPNEFTVGSRNIKGGGIASMGSQLEAGLSARPLTLPQARKRV